MARPSRRWETDSRYLLAREPDAFATHGEVDEMKKKSKRKKRGKGKPLSDDVSYITKYCWPFISAMRRLAPYQPEPERKEILETAEAFEGKILSRLLIKCMHDKKLPEVDRAIGRSPFRERNLDLVTKAYMNVAYSQGRRPTFKEIHFEVCQITPRGEAPPSFKTVERIAGSIFQVERRRRNQRKLMDMI